MKTLTRKFGLIIFWVAIVSLVTIIIYTNIYCTVLPNNCTEYNLGANGSWFEIKN